MFARRCRCPRDWSFFLLGPRGTGKTQWMSARFPKAIRFDLLDISTYIRFLQSPQLLEQDITLGFDNWVIIDEVQKVPELLNHVHRLIESRKIKFILSGSSARALHRSGVNLLAGRALIRHLYPLTAEELGNDFSLEVALKRGGFHSRLRMGERNTLLHMWGRT